MKYILAVAAALIATSVNAGTAVKNGNVLTINGTFDEQMSDQFNAIDKTGITHVKLESGGGSVYYGKPIADWVYDNRATVYTEATGGCASMCAETWLAADHHVFNKNARIGFHLSYIDDLDYWRDQLDDYGHNGVEYRHKYSVLNDLIFTFKYFDNKSKFNEFMEGVQEDGVLGHHIWYPTDEQLVSWEGGWRTKPKGSPKKSFEPTNKGWGMSINSHASWKKTSAGNYKVEMTYKITNNKIKKVFSEFYDIDGNLIDIGWKEAEIKWGHVYQDQFKQNTTYTLTRYSKTKPRWLKFYSEDGINVRWVKLT